MAKEKLTPQDLDARLKFILGITLGTILLCTSLGILYGLLFVTQPIGAQSENDKMFFNVLGSIATFITGTLAGILIGSSGAKDIMKAQLDNKEMDAKNTQADKKLEALMKGSLHTDELIHAVVMQPGLRTGRRMSHVFRCQVPMYPKPLYITDAALNIAPTLSEKADIVQNAIDFAHVMGLEEPKVAILAAVETVNPSMPSTLDAAALCKMAERGQIKGGVLDGPLAFDNAISAHAAEIKHIVSPVAGQVDILVAPHIEAGNMMIKQVEILAGASGAGIVLGARVPIALTSRSDTAMARSASALLVKLVVHHNRKQQA
jgi:phosphate acetyltransferase